MSLVSHLNPLLEVANPLPESTEFCVVSVHLVRTLAVFSPVATIHLPFSLAESVKLLQRLGKLNFKSRHFYVVSVGWVKSVFSGDET